MEDNVEEAKSQNADKCPDSDETSVVRRIGDRDKWIFSTIILFDFAATIGLGVAFVALLAGCEFVGIVRIIRFTTPSGGISVFPRRAIFDGGV